MASGGGVNTNMLSDETFDQLCTMCIHQGKNTEAEKYCVDCHDHYCLTCVKVHSQVPLLLGHKILDKEQFKPGNSQVLPMAPTERCNRHCHKHIDMYCQNHDDVGCSTCIVVDHRLCKDIFYIPEFVQNSKRTETPRDIYLELEAIAKTLTERSDSSQQEKQRLLKSKSELLDKIRRFRKEVNARLDELEKSSVNEIENKIEALIGKINEVLKQIQTNKVNVTSAKDKLAVTSNNVSEVFVNVKKGEKFANRATKHIHSSEMRIQVGDIEFSADVKILALLEEINVLGEVIENNIEFIAYKVQQKNCLQIKGKQTYQINLQSDIGTCDIVSACALEDGTIILSDYVNANLKRLDSVTYTLKNYCTISGSPWQVCSINKKQVAVSSGNEIHFISVQIRMRCTRKIETDHDCYGLAYTNNNLYISTWFKHAAVYIYTLFGQRLKHIDKDMFGHAMFSNIRSLAVSKDASKIYVIDSNKGPLVLDNDGRMVREFKCPQLQGASGCCINEAGNLLVSGKDSKNVLQFGPNGDLIGEVLNFKDEISKPRAICCNQQITKLIVGRYDKSYVYIEVYDIWQSDK